jgi:hypothetical protein
MLKTSGGPPDAESADPLMKLHLKYVVPPLEAKNIPLGQKTKRGRPSKAKRALIVH